MNENWRDGRLWKCPLQKKKEERRKKKEKNVWRIERKKEKKDEFNECFNEAAGSSANLPFAASSPPT